MTLERRKEICRDFSSLPLFEDNNMELADDEQLKSDTNVSSQDGFGYSIVVIKRMTYESQTIADEEIFFSCPIVEKEIQSYSGENRHVKLYYISSAFQINEFNISEFLNSDGPELNTWAMNTFVTSPEFFATGMNPYEIQDLYLRSRRNIGTFFVLPLFI